MKYITWHVERQFKSQKTKCKSRLIIEGRRNCAKKIGYAFDVLRDPSRDFADQLVLFVTAIKQVKSMSGLPDILSYCVSVPGAGYVRDGNGLAATRSLSIRNCS
ncbi:MAG: hypothetical protein F4Z82_04940 [Caldilineaceae bacterium SB0668_bin_21]|nr:hypothetical protein [Caldilineaceae bacterium SB0668_bin_21]MYC20257.1 hypothetical protein [Caldilineaceae bacterium SB0662_bin_25]